MDLGIKPPSIAKYMASIIVISLSVNILYNKNKIIIFYVIYKLLIMATAVYKVNYQGLRKRESYNEIVDYLENKQEKINYPNRFAKQIRNSPELSNLLDGEGMGAVEMEEQQLKAMEHEQAEQAVRQAGGTAQVLRAAASQTDKPAIRVGETQTRNPRMASTGSQAWKPNVASGGVQTAGPQTEIFDMTLDDNVDAMMDEVQAVSDHKHNK